MSVQGLIILVLVIAGAVIALFGWDRYRGGRKAPSGPGSAAPTEEVFIDPETGRRMRVWYDSATGQRDYRPE